MSVPRIAITTADPALFAQLQQSCPAVEFTRASPEAVVIADSTDPASVAVTIYDGLRAQRATYVVGRALLVANAPLFTAMWIDTAAAASRLSTLETELGFARELQQLFDLDRFEAVTHRITTRAIELAGVETGTLLLHDHKAERFVASFSNDPDYRESGDYVPAIPTPLLHRALHASEGYAVSDASPSKPTLLIIPIRHGEDMIGVFRFSAPGGKEVDQARASDAAAYVGVISQAFANLFLLDRTNDLAMRDDLTKAYNRRFFEVYLEEEIERARRYGSVMSIIFLDLDDLKLVNNAHGHLIGSRTLQEVAKRILGAVRAIDKVVRFGGDEFCIILPETDEMQARAVASRVRKSLGGSSYRLAVDIDVAITASFGIATYPQHATNKDDLVRQADAAMFAVKSTTKDSIGVAGPVPSAAPVELE